MKKGRPHPGEAPSVFIFFIFQAIPIKISNPIEMTSEFFRYHWFWNRTKIATYRRPRGAYDIEALKGAFKVEGASRESPQNLDFFFNIDEHLTSCLRMDNLLSIIENENIKN